MNDKTFGYIMQGGQLLATYGPVAIKLATQIKHLIEQDKSLEVNLENELREAVAADQATMDEVNAWREEVGLPRLD